MKKYSKADLQEKADRIMKAHKVDAVFGTNDGEIFLKEHEAKSHVRDTGGAPGETLEVYAYGKVEAGASTDKAPADDVDLHGDAKKLKEEKAEKAKAAENAKVPGAGKGKAAQTIAPQPPEGGADATKAEGEVKPEGGDPATEAVANALTAYNENPNAETAAALDAAQVAKSGK
jgi:hypothetical protein